MGKLSLFVLLTLFQACVGEKKSNLEFSGPETRTGSITVNDFETFAGLKSKIMDGKCISCHQNFATEDGIAKYVVAKKPELSQFFIEVENGSMPKGSAPLSTLELEVVTSYINNLKVPDPIPSGKVDFLAIQKQILIPSCVQCHQGMASEQNLLKWINRKQPLKSIFLKVVKNGSMPKGGAKLSLKEQDLIRNYLRSFIK
jgi:mono/diheme cytochrome c family protein